MEKKINLNFPGSHSSEDLGSGIRSTSGLRCMSPDCETKEIKNIYVDCKLLFLLSDSFFRISITVFIVLKQLLIL